MEDQVLPRAPTWQSSEQDSTSRSSLSVSSRSVARWWSSLNVFTALNNVWLQEFVSEMEHPRVVVHRHEWEQRDDYSSDSSDDGNLSNSGLPRQRPFCLQRFIEREPDVSFLVLWRCKHRNDELRVQDNISHDQYARSFYKRPLPLLTSDISSKCDVFLFQRLRPCTLRSGDTIDDNDDNDDDGEDESSAGGATRDSLVLLNLESPTLFKDTLLARGFDSDVIVSQLGHMKLTASEILNRLNRGLHARQACGACVAASPSSDVALSALIAFMHCHQQESYASSSSARATSKSTSRGSLERTGRTLRRRGRRCGT